MASELVAVVAHQGGWDEAAFVALPLVVLVVLLRTARRRAEREAAEEAGTDAGTEAEGAGEHRRAPQPPEQGAG